MQDDELAAILERINFHYARQSEIIEATEARMQNALAHAQHIREAQKDMHKAIDRLEARLDK